MVEPVPIEEARRRKRRDKPPSEPGADDPCPVVPIGHVDGDVVLLDAAGQQRRMNARQMVAVGDLSMLFLGDTAWLTKHYGRKQTIRRQVDGEEIVEERIVGFNAQAAGQYLMRQARAAGLFGPHVATRKPGIWRGEDNAPVVHAGGEVLIAGQWRRAGFRDGDAVWAAYPTEPRPGLPCDRSVAEAIQADIRTLWQFRHSGGEIVALGVVACGHLGQALGTRPNCFLMGGTNSGKTMLLHLMRACAPQHHFTTDTSKAGLEQALDGSVVPSFVDESSDRRGDGNGAERLLDIVLGATTGDGARIHRGTTGGRVRSVTLASVITMAATNPPEMLPQHLRRFTLVEMVRPAEAADHRAAMEAAISRCSEAAPGLWARTLAAWPRWPAVMLAYRDALGRAGCDVSAMDLAAAWLAGWWVLVEDGIPSPSQALDGVGAVAAYLRIAAEVADDDAPRRMLRHLASTLVQRQHSTDRISIATLIELAYSSELEAENARRLLARHGIRIIRESDAMANGKPVSRRDLGDGLWFAIGSRPLRECFAGAAQFEGDRWIWELMRLPSAVKSAPRNVRVGELVGPAIWLSRRDWQPAAEDDRDPPDGGKPRPPDG